MSRNKHIINIHTSTGTTEPTGASLYLGEIAVQHTPNDPALWIKVGTNESSNVYEKFIGETKIIELIGDSEPILGSGYTYSGIPYVNSSTTIADAYSALTNETILNEKVTSAAFNYLNNRIFDLSGGVKTIKINNVDYTGTSVDLGSYPTLTQFNNLSGATRSHITNTALHTSTNQKIRWDASVSAVTLNSSSMTVASGKVDLDGIQMVDNLVTAVTSTSTHTQYPSAKCVYDILGDIDTALTQILSGGTS